MDAFKASLLKARLIVTPGSTSGLYITEHVLPKLGISDRVSIRVLGRSTEATALVALGEAEAPSLLAGLVWDATGRRLIPRHTTKRGVRYRYDVSPTFLTGAPESNGVDGPDVAALRSGRGSVTADGQRIPAVALEGLVVRRLRELLGATGAMLDVARDRPAPEQQLLPCAAAARAAAWDDLPAPEQRRALQAIVSRVQVHADRVKMNLDVARLLAWLGDQLTDEAAEAKGLTPSYATRLMRLTCLDPDLTARRLAGEHPPELTTTRLMADTRLRRGDRTIGTGGLAGPPLVHAGLVSSVTASRMAPGSR